jgi:hypothetical protein
VQAADAFYFAHVRAQLFILQIVSALAHQVKIEIGEQGREGVGVVNFKRAAVWKVNAQAIRRRRNRIARGNRFQRRRRNQRFEQAVRMDAHRSVSFLTAGRNDADFRSAGLQGSNDKLFPAVLANPVRTQDAEGIGMLRAHEQVDLPGRQGRERDFLFAGRLCLAAFDGTLRNKPLSQFIRDSLPRSPRYAEDLQAVGQ